MTRRAQLRMLINRHSVPSSDVHLVDHSCLKVCGPAEPIGASPSAEAALGGVADAAGRRRTSIKLTLPRGGGRSPIAMLRRALLRAATHGVSEEGAMAAECQWGSLDADQCP